MDNEQRLCVDAAAASAAEHESRLRVEAETLGSQAATEDEKGLKQVEEARASLGEDVYRLSLDWPTGNHN